MTDVFSYISFDDPWESVPFEVDALADGDRQTFVLRGELDLSSADKVGAMLSQACSAGPSALVIDLSEVTYMDSSGLRLIIATSHQCHENKTEFALVPGPPEVQRLFDLTGATENLPFTGGASAEKR